MWPWVKGNDSQRSFRVCSNLDNLGGTRYIHLERSLTGLTARPLEQLPSVLVPTDKHITHSVPSRDCFLILRGHSTWQHLDFKVNVKGSFVFKNETKDKQHMLGSPEITFCTAGL